MAAITDTPRKSLLDRPLVATLVVNWELILYAAIFVVALITRFYDLGARVMSHDESLHALYSFRLYNGEGYVHDPLMHGPLQFHLVALSYLIFGDNDFSARIPAALFGVALVILPYWFRPWLGRVGALVTSFGLLVSPMLLYYQRYIRNEAFLTLFMALMALALFQYMRTRHIRWLYIGTLAVVLSLAVKAVGYINGFIGFVFIVSVLAFERWPQHTRRFFAGLGAALLALVLVELAIVINAGADASAVEESRLWGVVLMAIGLVVGIMLVLRAMNPRRPLLTAAVTHFFRRDVLLAFALGPLLISIIVFFLLYTTFFTNPAGFVSSIWGSLTYWLGQHEVNRGSQPGYYYLMLMPLYEFMPFIIGIVAAILYTVKGAPAHADQFDAADIERTTKSDSDEAPVYASDSGLFAAFLIWWALSTFVIFSWAGEKMPWLTSHITLPFIFLMGHAAQTVLDKFNWRSLTTREGWLFMLAAPLFGAVILVALFAQPFQGQSLNDISNTLQFVTALAAAIGLAAALWWLGRRLGKIQVEGMVFLVLLVVLGGLTIRFAWKANYVNYDYVNEFLVYAHGAPDVKWVLDQVDEISRRTVGDDQIRVAYAGVIWPLEWYMREYPNKVFFKTPSRDVLDAPVVLVSPDPEISLEDVEPYLDDDYQRYRYRQVWWPVETYKGQTFRSVWYDYFQPDPESTAPDPRAEIRENWQNLWNIFFYREHTRHNLSEWPFVTRMYMFVRKDIQAQMWDYSSGSATLLPPEPDPYANLQLQLPAAALWGSDGAGEGQFRAPHAVTVSPQGQVYVTDSGNRRVQVFDQNGNFLKSWTYDGWQAVPADSIFELWGIAVSEDGRIYVADTWNHRVQIFDEDGNLLGQFGNFGNTDGDVSSNPGSFWGPREIAIDSRGDVYISDTGNKRIQKFDADGNFLAAFGGGGVLPGQFEEPVGLAFDSEDNLYVVDTWNQRIQKFDTNFTPLLQWEVVGWDSENAANKPFITIDSRNRVFISDPENYRVIAYDTQGMLLGTFGQFGQDAESFRLPLDLVAGPDGGLFVVDHANQRVMKFVYP